MRLRSRGYDKQLRALHAARRRQLHTRTTPERLAEARLAAHRLGELLGLPDGVVVETVGAAGRPAQQLTPDGWTGDRWALLVDAAPVVLPPRIVDTAARFARALDARVVVIGDRSQPEPPFPEPLRHAVAAYRWWVESGRPASRTILVGDSAGGGRALATLLAARQAGLPSPAGCLLSSPWVDLTRTEEEYEERSRNEAQLLPHVLRTAAEAYADGVPLGDPLLSPARAVLRGLPPLLVVAGGHEALLPDAQELAERARADGVAVDLVVGARMQHAYHQFEGLVREADEALEQVRAWALRVTPPLGRR